MLALIIIHYHLFWAHYFPSSGLTQSQFAFTLSLYSHSHLTPKNTETQISLEDFPRLLKQNCDLSHST